MLPAFDPAAVPDEQIPAAIATLGAWQAQLAARLMKNPTPVAPAAGSLLTAAEMAQRLNIHESAVRTMEREGKIPGVRIGRYVRFDPQAVAAVLARSGP
jgi:excisionase family DNA binding protein